MKSHTCPHCGSAHYAHGSRKHHQCMHCGGSFFSSLVKGATSLAKAAAPHVMSAVAKHAPGVINAVQQYASHPLAQAALGAVRQHVGLGRRRTRPPTAHALAVKHVMAQHGMGLAHASRYVKEHGLARRQ